MSFLDNSGDIILDVVLTDTGRQRLARGDGSFKITKFALSDDEINYGSYDKNHASGSAYYDLQILQTPVFEAFTNNSSLMKSKLISIDKTNLLYLPVLKLNELFDGSSKRHSIGAFVVAVDDDTEDALNIVNGEQVQGIMFGESPDGGAYIRVDQGLDTTEIPPGNSIDPDLKESRYIVEVDNRFAKLVNKTSGEPANVSYIDDDNIASYFFSQGANPTYVKNNSDPTTSTKQTISGPRGTFLELRLQASLELNTSTFLFTELGSTTTMSSAATTIPVRYIDSFVRVTGGTTGYSLDIPVRFVKKI